MRKKGCWPVTVQNKKKDGKNGKDLFWFPELDILRVSATSLVLLMMG